MKGMVFAAGLGTRLRPLTDSVPKALVELGGVAMLERVLTRMKSCGIGEAVVNVHHFADKVRDFLREHDDFGMRLHISDESGMLLDTGGGVAAAADWLSGDEPVLLHNADIYTDVDFVEMLRVHEASGADATLLTGHRATSRYLLFDKNMRMHGWTDIRSGRVRPERLDISGLETMAFGGVHIVSPRLVEDICRYGRDNGKNVFSITDYYIESCGRMYIKGWCQPAGTNWHDIGTLDKLRRAEECLGGGVRL
ncbi:nucleotidyltransferase family protein [Muribaculum intestinale]|jgi:NDP-sugar pyrophosphorylase family protein|uniref:nucleotidyltransferase family protein n=1 Tax=Muribaculum intestinale TaxID=1796646 RepID=UPI002432912A|nr:nucleotidyltransferase family protein [Muribaculum intestinale]